MKKELVNQKMVENDSMCHELHALGKHMRLSFALLMCFFCCPGVLAQDEVITSAMQEAINNGRNADELYMCILDGKKITVKEVNHFIESRDGDEYYFGEVYYKDKKLKDNTRATSFSFLPLAEYVELVYHKLPFNDVPLSSLSQRGKGFVFNEYGSVKFAFYGGDILTGSGPEENIRWNGNVDENGNIDGEGVGFLRQGKFYWTGFKGKFKQGFPEGEVIYCSFRGNAFNDKNAVDNYKLQVGAYDGEWASLSVQGSKKFSTDIPYEVNPSGRIIMSREYTKKKDAEEKEKKAKQLFKSRHIIEGCDFTDKNLITKVLKLEDVLKNPNTRAKSENMEKATLILAERMIARDNYVVEISRILKAYPEIANAKDVSVTWDDSVKVNIKDAFFDFLYNHNNRRREQVMFLFHDVYNEWGSLTEDEILDTEYNYVLTSQPNWFSNYSRFFPEGHYVGKDFYEAWAQAFVDNSKRMLKKNDPKMWVNTKDYLDAKVSYYDWLHYPRLSRNIGGYSEHTQLSSLLADMKKAPKSMLFNNRKLSFLEALFSKTNYVFKNYNDKDNQFQSGVFSKMGDGGVFDEAKKYRSILDAIGAAAQIDNNIGVGLNATQYGYNLVRWIACHEIVDVFLDGLNAANELSGTTPEIRPACGKFKDFIKQKVRLLKTEVFDKYDDLYEDILGKAIDSNLESKRKDQALLQEVENLALPQYEYEDEKWERLNDDMLKRKICFKDLTEVSCVDIWKAKDGSYYETVGGAFIRVKYKTEKDAIIASYAYLKYGLIRQKGRL